MDSVVVNVEYSVYKLYFVKPSCLASYLFALSKEIGKATKITHIQKKLNLVEIQDKS